MRFKALVVTTVTLVGTCGVAAAQTPQSSTGLYVGAGAGQSDFDVGDDSWGFGRSTDDDTDTAWRVFGGARPHPNIGAEIGYFDFGETTGSLGASAEVQGVDLVGVGFLPLFQQGPHQIEAFGKLGGYWWDADVGETGLGSNLDGGDDFDYTFGAGVQYHFDNVGLRLEWQQYNDVFGEVDTDTFMGSVAYRF